MAKKKKKDEEDEEFKSFMKFLQSGGLDGKGIEDDNTKVEDYSEDDEDDDEDFGCDCDLCFDKVSPLAALLTISKPFGMAWTDENIEHFLDKRGYVILHLKNSTGMLCHIALKKSDSALIPDTDEAIANCLSVHQVFEKEIQSILIDWLLKIGNNNNENNGK